MNFPKEIIREAHGYRTMRLERYDLTDEQWEGYARKSGTCVARSVHGFPFVGIGTYFSQRGSRVVFVNLWGEGENSQEFETAQKAIVHHEKLAAPIVERLDLMDSAPAAAMAEGML